MMVVIIVIVGVPIPARAVIVGRVIAPAAVRAFATGENPQGEQQPCGRLEDIDDSHDQ
jgi:hypothetical protein